MAAKHHTGTLSWDWLWWIWEHYNPVYSMVPVLLGVGLGMWHSSRTRHKRQALLAKLGLVPTEWKMFRSEMVHRAEGYEIEVTPESWGIVWISVLGLPTDLDFWGCVGVVGDSEVSLQGSSVDRLIVLDPEVRGMALSLTQKGLFIRGGRLVQRGSKFESPEKTAERVREVLAFARAVARARAGLPRLIADAIAREPRAESCRDRGARKRRLLEHLALDLLPSPELREISEHPDVRTAIDPEVRWLAVIGRSDPKELEELVACADAPVRLRGRALRDRHPRVRPELEPACLDLVRTDDPGVRDVALAALESIGSRTSVAPLLELLDRRGLDDGTRVRVQRLVQKIQGLLRGSRGSVSLVALALQGGELSDLGHRRGALSEGQGDASSSTSATHDHVHDHTDAHDSGTR